MSREELIRNGKAREIGKRIRILRESELGTDGQMISQVAFGKSLGDLSLPKINRIENGRRMPDVEFLLKLKEEFNCDLDWLLTGEGQDQNESRASTKKKMLSMLKNDPDFRSAVLDELEFKLPTKAIRNKRIYNFLHSQRDEWQEIVARTEKTLQGASESQRKEAQDSVKNYKDGIDYLTVLLEVGRDPD